MVVIKLEVVAQTDYQDIYRITDRVLLVVNKFIPIKYEGKESFRVWKSKQCRYHRNCQEWLKVLQSDYYDEYDDITVPNGTVIYQDRPVVLSTNKADYQYQIKINENLPVDVEGYKENVKFLEDLRDGKFEIK